jgi:hypothetical protein
MRTQAENSPSLLKKTKKGQENVEETAHKRENSRRTPKISGPQRINNSRYHKRSTCNLFRHRAMGCANSQKKQLPITGVSHNAQAIYDKQTPQGSK